MLTALIMVQPGTWGNVNWGLTLFVYIFDTPCPNRPNLSSVCTLPADDRPLRFTDSPQHYNIPSTMSTTSGLGSNYTTNTSTGLSGSISCMTQPPTPSPRRKASTTSFNEVAELHIDRDNHAPIYIPGHYMDYRPHQQPLAAADEQLQPALPSPSHGTAYFGKNNRIITYFLNISLVCRFQLFSVPARSQFGLRTRF